MYLALLISNALLLHQLAVWFAGRVYRTSFSRMQTEQVSTPPADEIGIVDRLLLGDSAVTGRPPSQLRLLLVKELRLFRRDPVQWSQSLIFFGLLALYFFNIRRLQLQPDLLGDDRILEPRRGGADSVDVYDAIHLSDAEPGRAAVLDSVAAAGEPRYGRVDEILFRRRRLAASLLRI